MNLDNLDKLFSPKSIAIIGASQVPGSIGNILVSNLKHFGFEGSIFPVNPKYQDIEGIKCFGSAADINDSVDLAIIAVPAKTVPQVLKDCGIKKVGSAVIISAGFNESGPEGKILFNQVKKISEEYNLPVLGPNCLGFIRPEFKLNATFTKIMPPPGGLAFISQSGALGTAILDWAQSKRVGLSAFISVGEMASVNFHDVIEYFGNDEKTSAILLYIESVSDAQRFISAAKSASIKKPIIALKVGRSLEGAKAALSHTGSITGSDEIYDAVFDRCGILRVETVGDLFACAKLLAMQPKPEGRRLAIITNAGGPGVIATDELVSLGGIVAKLDKESVVKLNKCLPFHWSGGNPVDILGDADPERFKSALSIAISDPGVDGVMVILTPQAMTDPVGTARELFNADKITDKPIMAVFMGEGEVSLARQIMENGSLPCYSTPEKAVRAYVNVCRYKELLSEIYTPIINKFDILPDPDYRQIVKLSKNIRYGLALTEPEAKSLVSYYQIPVPKGRLAKSSDEAVNSAVEIGFPVIMKIVSPDIIHKVDVGGVHAWLSSRDELKDAYGLMMAQISKKAPNANITGVYIEEMIAKRHELLIGSKRDPVFGQVIVFGAGGTLVELMRDTAAGLAPLNADEAYRLIFKTKIYNILRGYRGDSSIDLDYLSNIIARVSDIVVENNFIKELDINPMVIDEHGAAALDVKIITDSEKSDIKYLSVLPYPKEIESVFDVDGVGRVWFKAVKNEDREEFSKFIMSSSIDGLMNLNVKFGPIQDQKKLLEQLSHPDYFRDFSITASIPYGKVFQTVAAARIVSDLYAQTAQVGVAVRKEYIDTALIYSLGEKVIEVLKKGSTKKIIFYISSKTPWILQPVEKLGVKLEKTQFGWLAEYNI